MATRRRFLGSRRAAALAAALALLVAAAAACGDDDEADPEATQPDQPPAETRPDADPGPDADGEPRRGGELTMLYYSEIAGLDPITSTVSGGSDGQQMFAFYGALVTLDPETFDIEPLLAQSFEPNDDFTVWTLVLRDGITFSDDTPFDAAAVMDYWGRIQDPASRSPAITTALNIAAMEVIDGRTLEITLARPNAHLDRAVERSAMNHVPSAAAVAGGHDFSSEPVGAGPFLLERWVRDDQMTMVPNPDWVGSDGPYLDRYTIRVLYDEHQRSNTFVSRDGDLNFTGAIVDSIEAGLDAGASWHYVITPSSPAYTFNTSAPPFDDVRLRRAFVQGVDHEVLVETAGMATPMETWVGEDSPWYVPEAALPPFDPDVAQALFDEVAEELGGPVRITIGAFQQSLDQARARFLQTSLNQYDNVVATIEVLPAPEAIGRVIQREYEVFSWGYPFMDPEPNLFNNAHSQSFTNFSSYSNPEVDAALEAARVTRDPEERRQLYATVMTQLAEDLPWWPYARYEAGFLAAPHVRGVEIYHEYILRVDLLWVQR